MKNISFVIIIFYTVIKNPLNVQRSNVLPTDFALKVAVKLHVMKNYIYFTAIHTAKTPHFFHFNFSHNQMKNFACQCEKVASKQNQIIDFFKNNKLLLFVNVAYYYVNHTYKKREF